MDCPPLSMVARGPGFSLPDPRSGRAVARDCWLQRLSSYHDWLGAWLRTSRDPATRFLPASRREAALLSSRAHLLAAEGLLLWELSPRPTRPARPHARTIRGLPPVIAGASDDEQLTRLIERAAAHQMRALSWVRQARDPAAQPVSAQRRRDMLLRAVEHIATSQRLLKRAQDLPHDGELDDVLGRHRAQLEAAAASVERFIHDLDAAQQM